MGIGRKRGPGGGGASLNFAVKAYSSEAELLAAVPKENTIGIITTTPITSWFFDAEEPETVADGMVWFPTGTSSTLAFNALKKNGIQVYPISAKQYVGGAWVDKTAMSYRGGEWVDWITYLYRKGYGLESNFVSEGSVTISDTSITGTGFSAVRTKEKFDFDAYNFKKIIAKVHMGTMVHDYPLNLVVTDNPSNAEGDFVRNFNHQNPEYPPDNAIAYSTIRHPVANAENTIELNIQSVTGQHYVGLGIGYHTGSEVLEIRFD